MTDQRSSSPPEEPLPPSLGQVFTTRQRQFYDVLKVRDYRLADMYLGSLVVLDQDGNPDRIPQAAHSMRELIEKLPRYLGFVIQNNPISLGQLTGDLAEAWDHTQISADGSSPSVCVPSNFVGQLKQFFDDFQNDHPRRREVGKSVINNLDPSGSQLPDVVQDLRAGKWLSFNNYFTSVSHHRTSQDISEYAEMVDNFENFLLDYLRPRAAESQADILRIIREAEVQNHGDS